MNPLAFVALWLAMQQAPTQHKFYITGYANDCEAPAVVAYGKDRVWALLNAKFPVAADLSRVTVWTNSEYAAMRKRIGKEFDDSCEMAKEATAVTAAKIDIVWGFCNGLIVQTNGGGYYCAMPLPLKTTEFPK